jgi:hypothetical protein
MEVGLDLGMVEMEQEIRPRARLLDQEALDDGACIRVVRHEERPDKVAAVGEDLFVKSEDAHGVPKRL